jgi:drug/metabolite transporter (DMT)-like permease
MILLFLHRLSPRVRLTTGMVLVVAGLALVALSTVYVGLLNHGIGLAVIGAVMCVSGAVGRRRAGRAVAQPSVDGEVTRAGSARDR